jgi:subtilisin
MIDTGVTPTPDLDIVDRTSLVGGSPDDVNATPGQPGHGTAVAHFAAGKVNGWGGAGAFPHARVASVRVFASAGGTARWQDYIRALDTCAHRDPVNTKVIVISVGGPTIDGPDASELENRISSLKRYGINVVVAAGNGGGEADFPGRFPASFAVAAIDEGGALCGFSARSGNIDVAAPGCSLVQAGWTGAMFSLHGTSFAAPIVAASLAAIRAYAPDRSAAEAEQVLLSSAERGEPAGLRALDAAAALRAVGRADIANAYRPELLHDSELPTAGSGEDVHRTVLVDEVAPARLTTALSELGPPGPTRPRLGALPRPAVKLKWLAKRFLRVRAANRPRGAILEVRAGARTTLRQSDSVTLKINTATGLRARFLTDERASPWRRVSIRRR